MLVCAGEVDPHERLLATLKLLQVCRSWRHIARHTPRLFTSLTVTSFARYANHLPVTADWIARSSPHLLHFVFDVAELEGWNAAAVHHCLQLVAPRLGQLTIGTSAALYAALARMRVAFLRLTHLLVFIVNEDSWSGPPAELSPLLPRLRTLELAAPVHLAHFRFPWAQLTSLVLRGDVDHTEYDDPYVVTGVLAQCAALERAELVLRPFLESEVSAGAPAIHLNHLSYLSLIFDDELQAGGDASPAPLLSRLHLPALRHLILGWNLARATLIPPTLSFLARNGATIESIELMNTPLETRELDSILARTPSLRSLTLMWVMVLDYAGVVWDVLKWDAERRRVPKLRDLAIYVQAGGRWPYEEDDLAMERMIRSRWWSDAEDAMPHEQCRLRSLTLELSGSERNVSREVVARLDTLVDQGLDLHLEHSTHSWFLSGPAPSPNADGEHG
ncbi:uncharacterized protein SCHCODRAFT_02619280 [Schizophyllum commune H4-8]|nr:uncharacterized protein SCHCODRAFT_02619280 [Schizophyllum commune H4-8]KAI5895386.1 hypothetical protein SCHCODRAFT_02619280 [Schizophyllum commune H4-8]